MAEPIFERLVRDTQRISRDEFAVNYGGVVDEVVAMFRDATARDRRREVRKAMESAPPLPSGQPRLRQVTFGDPALAPALTDGDVAAIDGKFALPMQFYSAGQVICICVGSVSWRRQFVESMRWWSSRAYIAASEDEADFVRRMQESIYNISQSSYMRYFEIAHGLEVDESHLFFDGSLVYEWLVASKYGVDLYRRLFGGDKRSIGIMKSLKQNVRFQQYAAALHPGEILVVETLAEHLAAGMPSNKNHGEGGSSLVRPEFQRDIAPHILRGIFKPRSKSFGFEVHEDDLEEMLPLVAADCQMNQAGHEIPWLLNRVDEELRAYAPSTLLAKQVAGRLAVESEELFLEESDEHDFR